MVRGVGVGSCCCCSLVAGCGASVASGERATQRVEMDGEAFELELALTPEQRHRGLSDVAEIPERGGMLFVFPEAAKRRS